MEKKVIIYTDGACSYNPGPGGYGAILMYNDIKKEISGSEKDTTNNRMELKAAIEALKLLKYPCLVDLYSDSSYLVNAFNEKWLDKWVEENFRLGKKGEVKNIDLWKELIELTNIHKVTFYHVKGHADNEYNNRCDEMARNEITKLEEKL